MSQGAWDSKSKVQGNPNSKIRRWKQNNFIYPIACSLTNCLLKKAQGLELAAQEVIWFLCIKDMNGLGFLIDCKDQREQIEGSSGKLKGLKGSMAEQNIFYIKIGHLRKRLQADQIVHFLDQNRTMTYYINPKP